jgi:YD repeat-containing protein
MVMTQTTNGCTQPPSTFTAATYNTAYDSHGNPTSTTQAGFGTTTALYAYDENGRILTKTSTIANTTGTILGTQTETYVYAADGSYTVTAIPPGSSPPSVTTTYDAKGNQLSVNYKDAGGITTMSGTYVYTFDTNGNPSRAVLTNNSNGTQIIGSMLYDWVRL